MAAQVEAKSLSAINHIAAHPPQYPINPIERHETLCLYISRVPGSRDVILSPFKPQQTSVGADDVANALYYIHLDTASDEAMAAAAKAQRQEASGRRSMESTRTEHRIVRKPLPASAKVSQPPSPEDEQLKPSPLKLPGQNKENVPITGDAGPAAAAAAAQQADASAPPVPVKEPTTSNPTTNAAVVVPIIRKPFGARQTATDQPPPPPYNEVAHHPPTAAQVPGPSPGPASPSPPTQETKPPLPQRRTAQSLDLSRASLDLPPTHNSPLASPTTRSPSPWSKHATHYSALPPPNNTHNNNNNNNTKPFTPFSLTIIRRDPGTGHQWNVGKVSSFQSTLLYTDPSNPDAPPVVQYPRGYPAINVHIETSGYARFRDFPAAAVLPSSEGGGGGGGVAARDMKELAAQMLAEQQQNKTTQQQQQGDEDLDGGFSRQVVMAYGKSWTSNLKEAFKGKGAGQHQQQQQRSRSGTTTSASDADLDTPLQPPHAIFQHRQQYQHQRNDSGTSTNSGDSGLSSLQPDHHLHHLHHHPNTVNDSHAAALPHLPPPPPPGLRPKGYTFTSPWNGACDFRTTSNGRALKCRHTRTTTSQGGFNPLVAAQALRDAVAADNSNNHNNNNNNNTNATGGGGGRRRRGLSAASAAGGVGSNTVPVSELRFNLPATDLFHSKEDRERAAREVREGLRGLVKSPGGYEVPRYDEYGDEVEDEEGGGSVFDWAAALGREKAGGGARGRRAKLGKLLVYDEGCKMLDLVVASNMGIWWQTWERNF